MIHKVNMQCLITSTNQIFSNKKAIMKYFKICLFLVIMPFAISCTEDIISPKDKPTSIIQVQFISASLGNITHSLFPKIAVDSYTHMLDSAESQNIEVSVSNKGQELEPILWLNRKIGTPPSESVLRIQWQDTRLGQQSRITTTQNNIIYNISIKAPSILGDSIVKASMFSRYIDGVLICDSLCQEKGTTIYGNGIAASLCIEVP